MLNKYFIVFFLISLIFSAGCAGKKSDATLTPEEEAAKVIRYSLRVMMIKADVNIRDYDNNGVRDIYITHLSEKEMTPYRRSLFFASITGVIAGSVDNLTFVVENVYLETQGELYRASVSDCEECLNSGRTKIEVCINEAWQKVE